MPQIIEFNNSSFASLVLLELTETWNDIGISDLPPNESEPLLLFLEQIEAFNQPEFDTQRLIKVKAAGGVLQAVYGPAIFRDGDQIVLKLGANLLPLTQRRWGLGRGNETKWNCPSLYGKIISS